MKISEFLVHLGENFGIVRTFLDFFNEFYVEFCIFVHFGIFLAWIFPKIDEIFQELSVHFAGCTTNFLVAIPLSTAALIIVVD